MGESRNLNLKPLFFLLNDIGEIQYSNINNKSFIKEWIKKADILNNISSDKCIKKEFDDYIIYMERIFLVDDYFWAVTIEKDLFFSIYTDFSTGLFNRNYWEHIKRKLIRLPENYYYSIVIIDIDSLKEINDKYGHLQGDETIKIVGQAIKGEIRSSDIAIHYAGDEFIIILPNTKENEAVKVVKRIRERIEVLYTKGNISISAGIAVSINDEDLETMLNIADKKMYLQKKTKNKKYLLF